MTKGLIMVLVLWATNSFGQDVHLLDFLSSGCDNDLDPYQLQTRIITQEFQGDILEIEVGTSATCCVEFKPSIIFSQDTLNLLFEETGSACECICCYRFTYYIDGLKDNEFGIKLQSKPKKCI